MEPWLQEEMRQLGYTARRLGRPRCVCCEEHIWSERYLDLAAFGLRGFACERCLEANMGDSDALEQ